MSRSAAATRFRPPAARNSVSGKPSFGEPLRLDPDLVPERFIPRHEVRQVNPLTDPRGYRMRRRLPSEEWFEKARRFTITGDPLADEFVTLFPVLGYARAREMLDTALEKGIGHVPDAPEPLRALFAEVDNPPEWVDWERIERGAAVMRRYAPVSWLFTRLAFAMTYVNANAGMPLYLSGSLGEKTVARRLRETDKWRLELHRSGGLRRSGEAFKTIVRVRVLHAMVRTHLIHHPEWDVQRLGMPIPQLDMAGANIGMFYCHSFMLKGLGARITAEEYEDVLHLWRYQGWLIGVDDDLNPTGDRHLQWVGKIISLTIRDAFDPRAAVLTQGTMNARLREGEGWIGRVIDAIDSRASHGFYFFANGAKLYRRMRLDPRKNWVWFAPAVFPLGFAAETVRRNVPGMERLAESLGRRYIERGLTHDHTKNAPFKPYDRRTD